MALRINVKRAAALITLPLLLAAALEVFLRLISFTLTLPSDVRNAVRPEDAGKLRILTLGESTTADFFSDPEAGAWPRRLERGLNEAGVPARVYNEGIGGTTSALILLRLPGYIEKYRPDMVVTMMGVNDHTALMYDGAAGPRLGAAIGKLRLVKLYKWGGLALNALRSRRLDLEPLGPEYAEAVDRGAALARKGSLPEVEELLRAGMKDDRTLALALSAISVKLRGDFNGHGAPLLAGEYSDRAFDLYPFHHDTAFWELHYHVLVPGSPRLAAVSKKVLECGPNLSDDLLSLLAIAIDIHPELARSAGYWPPELRVLTLKESPARNHYRLLARELRENGIVHIAMQYPTLPVETLKAHFLGDGGAPDEKYRKIIFVSNRENFLAAVGARGYDALFTDRFRGSWGHSTGLGHQLIADAVKSAVLAAARAGKPGASASAPGKERPADLQKKPHRYRI